MKRLHSKLYSHTFYDKEWQGLIDLATQVHRTYDEEKKDTGFTYKGNEVYSIHKWIIGIQGEFLFEKIFKDIKDLSSFDLEIYHKKGDGGFDNMLGRRTIEMKTSEATVLPNNAYICLCGELNKAPKHHLLAFPQRFAGGKYRLGLNKDVAFLFKTNAKYWKAKDFEKPHTEWDNPLYTVEFCGFRSNKWMNQNIQEVQLKSGPNLAYCEKQLYKDINILLSD